MNGVYGEQLDYLCAVLEEKEGCRQLSDELLAAILEDSGGDVRQAIYRAALLKARDDAIRLPDGTTLPGMQEHWLRVAAMYRPSGSRPALRADDMRRDDR